MQSRMYIVHKVFMNWTWNQRNSEKLSYTVFVNRVKPGPGETVRAVLSGGGSEDSPSERKSATWEIFLLIEVIWFDHLSRRKNIAASFDIFETCFLWDSSMWYLVGFSSLLSICNILTKLINIFISRSNFWQHRRISNFIISGGVVRDLLPCKPRWVCLEKDASAGRDCATAMLRWQMIKTISIRKPHNKDLDYLEAHPGIFKVAESWWCAGTGGSCSRFLSRSMHWLGGGSVFWGEGRSWRWKG